ncbi:MAG: hypothetical protein R3B70_09095 [Polyangiaceae bacterium]
MIRAEALGRLKDGAATLVALSELLASRRVSPRAVGAALGSAIEACEVAEEAGAALGADVLAAARSYKEASAEIRALFEGMTAALQALSSEVASAERAPVDARARLALERAANDACARVAAGLFTGELFALASAPRPVTVRVVDVLGFGPVLPEGPQVVRATLDVPMEPITTADARLTRSLVEMCVLLVAGAGVPRPHVEVMLGRPGGARVRVREQGQRGAAGPSSSRSGATSPAQGTVLTVRRLVWPAGGREVLRAAASMGGVSAAVDPSGRGAVLELP